MAAKQVTYFRIKPENRTRMKRARKLVFFTDLPGDSAIYKTIAFQESEQVSQYLESLGIEGMSVSKMTLQE